MQSDFFDLSLCDWITVNSSMNKKVLGLPWSTLFAVTSWYVWHWRNSLLHDEEFQWPGNAQQQILSRAKECSDVLGNFAPKLKYIASVCWGMPMQNTVKMNVDGSVRSQTGHASAGGVLRNDTGDWLLGFYSGVATKHPAMSTQTGMHGGQMGYNQTGSAAEHQQQQQLHSQQYQQQQLQHPQRMHYEVSSKEEIIQRSNNSSSSEDDGMGGRRKKKGLKEKLTGGKNKEEEQSQTTTYAAKTTVTATTTATPGQQHHHAAEQHEKKSMMEKIKEKLPGHHSHH
ncbi:hypothetical protein REPUB_Repub01dG0215200 [Reevesia pubescens]